MGPACHRIPDIFCQLGGATVRLVRASRLVQLLLELQVGGPATAASLAERLEVSIRTVYRDVEALGAAGVPVYAERGPGGGIRLVDGYQTRLTGLTGDEAGAIGLLGLPSAAHQLGLGAVMATAQAKLDASLPVELRSRAQRVRQRFLLDAPGWFDRADRVPCLPSLSEAVWTGTRVELRYRRGWPTPDAPPPPVVRRRVGPLGLILKGGTWYLLAEAGRRRQHRVFRVDRVVSVRPAPGTVDRDDDLDLADAWRAARGSFESTLLRRPVTLRMPEDQVWRLRYCLTSAANEAALASARPDPGREGWHRLVVPAESVEVAHDELLRAAAHLEVLEPEELRLMLAETGRELVRRHDPGPASVGRPSAPRPGGSGSAPAPPPGADRGEGRHDR